VEKIKWKGEGEKEKTVCLSFFYYFFTKVFATILKRVKIATAITKFAVPCISQLTQEIPRRFIAFSRSQRIIALITRIKSPKVSSMKGKPRSLRIGRTNTFKSPRIIPPAI